MKEEIKVLSEHIVKAVDFLLPILRLNLDVVNTAIDLFSSQAKEDDSVELSSLQISDVINFFPSSKESILQLLNLLALNIPFHGPQIRLLDVLTILTILVHGPISEKARLIFNWYNSSKSGMLSEVELRVFLTRTSNTLSRMKFIGRIDFTYDDILHLAFTARAINNNSALLPGLTFHDFYIWFSENPITKAMDRLTGVLSRLLEVTHSLENRTNALYTIFQEKEKYGHQVLPIPHYSYFSNCIDVSRADNSHISVIFLSSHNISLLISNLHIDTTQLFIECKKRCTMTNPYYKLARKLSNRRDSSCEDSTCCEKEYYLTSYQQFNYLNPPHWRSTGHKSVRIDIKQLEPDSKYLFTVYSKIRKYSPVSAHTQPPLKSTATATREDSNEAVKPSTICLLPASVTASEADVLITNNQIIGGCDGFIFTGTICPVPQILKGIIKEFTSPVRLLLLEQISKDYPFQVQSNARKYANLIATTVRTTFQNNWLVDQNRILYSRSVSEKLLDRDFYLPAASRRHVMTYVGMGPWGCEEWKEEFSQNIPVPEYTVEIRETLEDLYWRNIASLLPPEAVYSSGAMRVIFLHHPPATNKNAVMPNIMSVEDVPNYIVQMLSTSDSDGEAQMNSSVAHPDHLLFVVRSPLELLEPPNTWGQPKTNNTKRRVSSIRVEASSPEEETLLRGSHEIVHGEYTASDAATRAARAKEQKKIELEGFQGEDEIFALFCEALLMWMSENPKTRQVTIVSVGWLKGFNFKIYRDGQCAIVHECMLETTSMMDALLVANPLMQRMESSLPADVTLGVGLPSSPRFAILQPAYSGLNSEAERSSIQFMNLETKPISSLLPTEPVKEIVPIRVTDGPEIIQIDSKSVTISISVFGEGVATAKIYKIPMSANYSEAYTLLLSNADKLACEETIERKSFGPFENEFVITFRDLNPYTNYLISVQPTEERPFKICSFRTNCLDNSHSSSFITTSVTESDFSKTSEILLKISYHLDQFRSTTASPVYLQYQLIDHIFFREKMKETAGEISVASRLSKYLKQPSLPVRIGGFFDKKRLSRRTAVVTVGCCNAEKVHNYRNEDISNCPVYDSRGDPVRVNISHNGRFCRLAPDDDDLQGLVDLTATMDWMDGWEHSQEVESIQIFVTKPLCHYLIRSLHRGWVVDNHIVLRRHVIEKLLLKILSWKKQSKRRDCAIICNVDIKYVVCVVFKGLVNPENQKKMKLSSSSSETFNKYLIDNLHEPFIRHILLPSQFNSLEPMVRLPPAGDVEYGIGERIRYFVQDSAVFHDVDVYSFGPKSDSYGIHTLADPVPVYHIIDVIIPYENALLKAKEILYQKQIDIHARHKLVVRTVAFDADCLSMITGPVIGLVTSKSARVLFEFNRDLAHLKCMIRAVGFPEEVFEQEKKRIRPFRPITFLFENLKMNRIYEILLPNIEGPEKVLGTIRTPSEHPSSVSMAFTGAGVTEDLKLVEALLEQLRNQQTADIRNLLQEATYQNYDNVIRIRKRVGLISGNRRDSSLNPADSSLQDTAFNANNSNNNNYSDVVSTVNTWKLLANHLSQHNSTISSCIHLNSQSLFNSKLNDVITVLLLQISRIQLPLRDASYIHILHYYQLEDMFRDIFRLIWTIPSLKLSLQSVSNIFNFHSDYLLPISSLTVLDAEETKEKTSITSDNSTNMVTTEENKSQITGDIPGEPSTGLSKEVNGEDTNPVNPTESEMVSTDPNITTSGYSSKSFGIIRKLYETNVQAYITGLTDANPDIGHHAMVWRVNSMATVLFDIASNRKKLKKKKKHAKAGDEDSPNRRGSMGKGSGFSPGFIDETQWNLLKNILRDGSITQLVLCCQEPFLSLQEIPVEYPEAFEKPPKGGILPWYPTQNDLEHFFDLLFKWIRAKADGAQRSVCLVGSHDVPYTTIIQDLWTGIHIQQVCVGKFSRQSPLDVFETTPADPVKDDIELRTIDEEPAHTTLQEEVSVTENEEPIADMTDITAINKSRNVSFFSELQTGRSRMETIPEAAEGPNFPLMTKSESVRSSQFPFPSARASSRKGDQYISSKSSEDMSDDGGGGPRMNKPQEEIARLMASKLSSGKKVPPGGVSRDMNVQSSYSTAASEDSDIRSRAFSTDESALKATVDIAEDKLEGGEREKNKGDKDGIIMEGHLGKVKYIHRLTSLFEFPIDSSPDYLSRASLKKVEIPVPVDVNNSEMVDDLSNVDNSNPGYSNPDSSYPDNSNPSRHESTEITAELITRKVRNSIILSRASLSTPPKVNLSNRVTDTVVDILALFESKSAQDDDSVKWIPTVGFGILKIWFDSANASGLWTYRISNELSILPENDFYDNDILNYGKLNEEAVMTVGPVIGALYRFEKAGSLSGPTDATNSNAPTSVFGTRPLSTSKQETSVSRQLPNSKREVSVSRAVSISKPDTSVSRQLPNSKREVSVSRAVSISKPDTSVSRTMSISKQEISASRIFPSLRRDVSASRSVSVSRQEISTSRPLSTKRDISVSRPLSTSKQQGNNPIGADVNGRSAPDPNRVMVPIMIETSLYTRVKISVTNLFNSVVEYFVFSTYKNLPTICRLGPLTWGLRYLLKIEEGILNKDDFTTIITTYYHKSESNVVVTNHHHPSDVAVSSEFITDLTMRCSIPYSGIMAILHTNIILNLNSITEKFKQTSRLSSEILKAFHIKHVPWKLRYQLNDLFHILCDECREIFKRPSFKLLLKKAYNLFMLSLADQRRAYENAQEDPVEILFGLMIVRVQQEYFYQLSLPKEDNAIYAVKKIERPKLISQMSVLNDSAEAERIEEKRKQRSAVTRASKITTKNINTSNLKKIDEKDKQLTPTVDVPPDINDRVYVDEVYKLTPVDAILHQWLNGLKPAPMAWRPWRNPSESVVIEQCCSATVNNINELCISIDKDSIQRGSRIVIIDGDGDSGGADELFDEQLQVGFKFQKSVMKWSANRYDRMLSFVCPSLKDGTVLRKIQRLTDGATTGIMMLDSIFRSNNMIELVEEGDVTLSNIAKKLKRQNLIAQHNLTALKDGYIIIECNCPSQYNNIDVIQSPQSDSSDPFTFINYRLIRSIPEGSDPNFELALYQDFQGERSSPYDYLQIPDWFVLCSPASPAVLVRDEFTYIANNDERIRGLLDHVESSSLFAEIIAHFNGSRLSQMSMATEQRDVDLTSNDCVRAFFYDICAKVFKDCILPKFPSLSFDLQDYWILDYICSHLQLHRSVISSPIEFTTFIQNLLELSILLHVSFETITNQMRFPNPDISINHMLLQAEFPTAERTPGDESDLDADPTPEEIAAKAAKDRESSAAKGKTSGNKANKGKDGAVEGPTLQEKYFTAKSDLQDLMRQRIVRRRFYGPKFKFSFS